MSVGEGLRGEAERIPEVKVDVQAPKVIMERGMDLVKISENEVYGRIIRPAMDGFPDGWRSVSEVTRELMRRGWAPKEGAT